MLQGTYAGRRDEKNVQNFNARKQTYKMPENEGRKEHMLRN